MLHKLGFNALYLILTTIALAVAAALFVFGYNSIQRFLTERAPHHSTHELNALEEKIRALQREIDLAREPKATDAPSMLAVNKELEEISERFRILAFESTLKDSLMIANERFTSQGLTLATIWVGVVAIAFTVFVTFLGIGNFRQAKKLRDDLEKGKAAYEESQKAAQVIQNEIRVTQAGFESGRKELEEQTNSTLRFAQEVAESFFSNALLELLRELQMAGALTEEADATLRNKTKEVESRIFLRHPSSERVNAAIQVLEGLGSEAAIQDLSELIEDDKTSTKTRRLATRAIAKISGRP